MRTKQDQRGLTLIETMMMLAVVGILATIAIPPAYQLYEDSQARAQVTEAVNLLDSVKSPITGFYSENGRWPTQSEFDGLITDRSGKYVASLTPVTLPSGFQVTATFKNSGVSPGLLNNDSGRTLVLATTDGVKWVCNDSNDPAAGVPGLRPGTLLPQHRPASCK
ncbi:MULTISPECIES: pilin [unclassified Nitrosospira]|uniref:pilin n=1 Tax=unclassified Nitrosospira TaxID=2609267 RepID=UPI000D2F88D8|nr:MULTISPECIES: pilin [unclassified Nitrosospira]PTR15226.1 type IV pilus assembly protein PilA [Nitrosospira sp. Nsp2]WON72731.1 pilin [Nitrosospira sp. Is2]